MAEKLLETNEATLRKMDSCCDARTGKGQRQDQCHCHHEHHSPNSGPGAYANMGQASETRSIYFIANMDCPMEEGLIRNKLATVQGVKKLEFNLMRQVLTVEHTPGTAPAIEAALVAIDMAPQAIGKEKSGQAHVTANPTPWKKLFWATVIALFSEAFELAGEWGINPLGFDLSRAPFGDVSLAEILALVLALISIGLAGISTFKKGWLALSNFNLNINALMAVAVTGAVLIGQFPEAAMVMALFNISEAIEARALDRARNAIRDLMSLAPEVVSVRQNDGTWRELKIDEAKKGEIARALPGKRIALDGEVISGHSTVNQAQITGESMPVEKQAGDAVYAGTINENGTLEYRITAGANDTTLARIIHAVEDAQATRAPIQRFVDAFAKYYTPAVFLLAILWAIIPPIVFGASWHNSIYTSLVILVIGCPCALVISTPVTVVSGMAAATRKGILIKGGLYLEQGRRLNWLALDKTGTITTGQPQLTDFQTVAGFDAAKAKMLARGLASMSDHPVSRAIAEADAMEIATPCEVKDFRAIPGEGISGLVNGEKWRLGNMSLVRSEAKPEREIETLFESLESQGKTVVALAGPNGVAAVLAVADRARPSSIEAIKELKKLAVRPLMLTGDNEHTARAIANQVGINDYRANLLPGEKLEIISELEKQGNMVGMAGDGINDAPALAKATIGFAMARNGTDTAMETADVALMDDDLRKIPRFIRLSRATHAILVENITLALGIKAVFFALTLTGYASMWLAVFADVGAALLVVLNGLRAIRK